MTLPIQIRLTLWYSALLAGALLLFSLVVYLFMSDTLVRDLDTSLRQRINQVEATLDVSNGRLVLPRGAEQPDVPIIPAAVRVPSGRIVSGQVPVEVRQWMLAQPGAFGSHFQSQSVGNLRVAVAPIENNGRILGQVLAWQPLKPVDDARHSLFLVLAGAVPALLVIAGLGGLALARRALAPVATITHTASRISATDLRERVPVDSPRDQLSELASTFNDMIDRLGAAVQRERRFTADASHELRAPLAVIRAETSLALERPRAESEYRRVLGVVDDQADAMEELIAALLLLARVESLRDLGGEELSLAPLVTAAVAQCRASHTRADVTIAQTVDPNLTVRGSPSLLTRAIRNVVDNAIKHSPPHGSVQIRASRHDSHAVLDVEDQGPGISSEDREHVFEPFFQAFAARTPGESHGLGLAICRRIVEAHGGTVSVTSSPGESATFTIALPKAEPAGDT